MAHDNFRRMQALDAESSLAERSLAALRSGVSAAGEWHDEIVLASTARIPLACKAGCSSCCTLPAAASFGELAHLAAFVIESFEPEALASLKERLGSEAPTSAGPARAGDKAPGRVCALLVAGSCSAHPARPMACRGWNSRDVAPCISAAARPDAPPSIPVDARVHATARAIAEGMRDGARSLGLDDSVLDLRAGLGVLLEDLAGWTRAWFDGERLPLALHSPSELSVEQGTDGLWRTKASS